MMGGVSWIKMSGTMVDPRRETLKLHWLKCPKLLSKYKFEPESKWFSLILHYSFAQKTSIILRTSTHSILSKIYSCNTAKNHVSGWRQKKHLHCTISRRQKTAFSEHVKSKFVHSCKNPSGNFYFRDVRKLLFGGELNNFLHPVRCLGLVKCFKIFHFLIEIFRNSTIF